MFNKKGQSLVEVVVALSILIIVLTAVITLIVNVLNLTLMSRNNLKAVSLAEKKLTERLVNTTIACPVVPITFPATQSGTTSDGFRWQTELLRTTDPTLSIDSSATGFADANYYVVRSLVTWTDKQYGDNRTELIQVVGKIE